MAIDTEHSIRHELRRAFERDVGAGSTLALTIRALCRSDADRLTYWSGDRVADDFDVQRAFRPGDDAERFVIEQAQASSTLRPAIGWAMVDRRVRPEASAWLLDGDQVIDPERGRRSLLGLLGVALRPVEVARWTPNQPFEVAVGDSRRLVAR